MSTTDSSLVGDTGGPGPTGSPNTNPALQNPTPSNSTTPSSSTSLSVSSTSPPSNTSTNFLTSSTPSASASPSAAVTDNPQTTPPTGSNHLSAGGIAGVAIGCAALGALLAFLFMVLLRRSQTKSSSRHRQAHSRLSNKSLRSDKDPDKSLARPSVAAIAVQPNVNIDAFLPQQADDATVKQRVLLLFDQIELHVDNYYSDQPLQLTPEQQSELSRFGTPELPMPLGILLNTSQRKVTIIKHCLAFHVVQLVSPSHGSDCLLPYEVSNVLVLSTPKSGDRNFHLALSRWRMLTAYLRPDLFDGKESDSTAQDAHLYNLAKTFSDRFAAFSQPQNAEQKVKHLAEVLRTAVKVALWLYSQPATFKFDWGPASDASRRSTPTVATVPSLLKTHDGMGGEIQPPQTIQPLVKRRV
ncbi:uncharacterized protein PV07_03787 [Cladophialophora immunda]|uniref:Uncharacterized protein n=1 Tax=Cladophialophora immunda TaxID=569365 RepID=A0A0D2B3P2_9EURO|nr:uncharacterized protein PV07_03787 [Cladophialophora immunda]KIW32227.1 hypothetical protein PV07_03787 [Cladophialophora immunda]